MINSFIFVPISVRVVLVGVRCAAKNNTEGTYILNNIVDEDKTHYNFL